MDSLAATALFLVVALIAVAGFIFAVSDLGVVLAKYTLQPLSRWFLRVFMGIDRPLVGPESVVGALGNVSADFQIAPGSQLYTGRVRVQSETWSARSTRPIAAGSNVRVVACTGAFIDVEPKD